MGHAFRRSPAVGLFPAAVTLVLMGALGVLPACSQTTAGTSHGPPAAPTTSTTPDPDAPCRETVASPFTRPTRLTDSGPGCDYAIEGRLDVTADLTVEAGTRTARSMAFARP